MKLITETSNVDSQNQNLQNAIKAQQEADLAAKLAANKAAKEAVAAKPKPAPVVVSRAS